MLTTKLINLVLIANFFIITAVCLQVISDFLKIRDERFYSQRSIHHRQRRLQISSNLEFILAGELLLHHTDKAKASVRKKKKKVLLRETSLQ